MTLIYWFDLLGTLVFAISGAIAAYEKKFDLFGVMILATATAVGGGSIRDVMIGSLPVAWLLDLNYVYAIIVGVALCYFFRKPILNLRKTIFLFDSMGIALFTILGIQKSLDLGLSPVICVLMGIISAVFGGVVRDTMINEIPLVFRKELYATSCMIGGIVYFLLLLFSIPFWLHISIPVLIIISFRILSVTKHWSLPKIP